MLDKPICIVDIETTGASARTSRITEIAVIKVDTNGNIKEEFQTLINPQTKIPHFITKLTNITDEDVENAPTFNEVAPKISELFEKSYLLAHNVLFDFSFIKRQMKETNLPFSPRLLCSLKLSRKLYGKTYRSHSLESIINRHGLTTNSRHRAYDDTLAVYDFLKIAEKEHGADALVESLKSQLKYKTLPTNFDESFLDGIQNSPGVYIFKDKQDNPVYIGKSVNLRNRVLSHFNQSTTLDKEMKISLATHKLETIETSTEIEALLLESKLIKEKLPIYNRMLRKKETQVVLTTEADEAGYLNIKLNETDISKHPNPDQIFGIYKNRAKAKDSLLKHRADFNLCSKLLGLEKPKGACFHYQLGKCYGACIQKEPKDKYNFRLNEAFNRSRIKNWKYKSPIVIKLNEVKGLIIDHWVITGIIEFSEGSSYPETSELESSFDLDTYKILLSSIRKKKYEILPLSKLQV